MPMSSRTDGLDPKNRTGGERGIRTLDTLLEYARFPGVCLQPLGHLSAGKITVAKCAAFFNPNRRRLRMKMGVENGQAV